jgi:hypothetical protein
MVAEGKFVRCWSEEDNDFAYRRARRPFPGRGTHVVELIRSFFSTETPDVLRRSPFEIGSEMADCNSYF